MHFKANKADVGRKGSITFRVCRNTQAMLCKSFLESIIHKPTLHSILNEYLFLHFIRRYTQPGWTWENSIYILTHSLFSYILYNPVQVLVLYKPILLYVLPICNFLFWYHKFISLIFCPLNMQDDLFAPHDGTPSHDSTFMSIALR